MNFSLDITGNTRSVSNLEKYDLIEYESEYIDLDRFVVLSVEKDDSIPAILLQLWRFRGGYNHSISNVMQNDLGLNKQVPYFQPKKISASVLEISQYRPKESGLTRKEEYFFDLYPEITSESITDECNVPYKAKIELNGMSTEIILPEWTPLQKLPLEKIKKGTILEIWELEDASTVMRVIQL